MAVVDAIPGWKVQQFAANVRMALQATGGKLQPTVTTNSGYVGESAAVVNILGQTKARKITGRLMPSPTATMDHQRRWVAPVGYDWGDLVDSNDRLFTGIEATGMYTQAGAAAMRRAQDDEIFGAFFGTSVIGQKAELTEAWSDINGDTLYYVSETVGGSPAGTACGLNKAKLLAIKKIMMKYFVDFDQEELHIAITEDDWESLMGDPLLLSTDYVSKQALMDGQFPIILGFHFHQFSTQTFELLTDFKASANIRSLPAWVKSGMHLGMWLDMESWIRPDVSFSGHPRIYMKSFYGATRLDAGKVVKCRVKY